MNSVQLENLLLLDEEISKSYIGIYPIDKMPGLKNVDNFMVVNLDPSFKPGSHWVVLYKRNNKFVEYFDSTGSKPNNKIVEYLFSQNNTCIYSYKRLQDFNSNTCGLFCLFYCYYACRSCNLESIVTCFSDNLKLNEAIVKRSTRLYLTSNYM